MILPRPFTLAWFSERDLHRWREETGQKIEINVVAREDQPTHFEAVLAALKKYSLAFIRCAESSPCCRQ